MLNVEKTLNEKFPELHRRRGSKWLFNFLKAVLHEKCINDFIQQNQHLKGFSFLNAVLDHFHFSYSITNRDVDRIPSEGRIVIVANHPIGSLDGLALLKLVHSVRPDVRIVANDLLSNIEPLKDLFLSVDNMSGKARHKATFTAMIDVLEREEAVIIFPAGEVSRLTLTGVRDSAWKTGFLKLAIKTQSHILPIQVEARNSAWFYALSALYRPLGTMMLVKEMYNKQHDVIHFHVGKMIDIAAVKASGLVDKKLANQFRQHTYRLHKQHKGKLKLFRPTIETVMRATDSKVLKKAIGEGELLGETFDGKRIYLFEYDADSPVMHEIGRLREKTFRTVGEGTGRSCDLDKYDADYLHLVLWDDDELDIVGAYRIGDCARILAQKGKQGLYIHSIFELQAHFDPYLEQALEMGRSFVQPKYWGKRSLDYLWYGIGAYLTRYPHVRYLFGPVSVSGAYPQRAQALIVAFYLQQFGSQRLNAKSRQPFVLDADMKAFAAQHFSDDYKTSFKRLTDCLAEEGVKVPTLYKQYVELCKPSGVHFEDFGVDMDFNDALDGFFWLDIEAIKAKKRQRYFPNRPIRASEKQ